MSLRHVKYLLVGGGLASSSAAQEIRKRDSEGSMMLVGQEINRPYHRPPLSKEYLRGEKKRSELFTLDPEWFAANQVQLRTGVRAAQIDASRRTVMLDSGEEISFNTLLIATGGTAQHLKIPGAELANVFYVRTLEDVDRLQNSIDKAKNEGRPHARGRGQATVIGGGVLGVELAASLTQMGLQVDLVCSRSYPWDKFAGENTGRFLSRFLENHGIQIHPNQRPERFEGDGRAQRVVLGPDLSIECDLIIAAVGMEPNKELLRGTPVIAEKAILVDEHCRTSVPEIYAAGDCAALFDPLFGKHRILDHWDNAITTGTLAGKNMSGANERYDAANYFFSDVFNLSISAWGEAKLAERRLLRGNMNEETPNFIEIGTAPDGRIVQTIAVNHPNEDDLLRDLVKHRINIDGHEEKLKDPHYPLEKILEKQ